MDQISDILSHHKHSSSMQTPTDDATDDVSPAQHPDNLDHLFDEIPLAEESEQKKETAVAPNTIDMLHIKSELISIKHKVESLLNTLDGVVTPSRPTIKNEIEAVSNEGTVLEGVFNGEKMVGPDGKEYAVPPNYASKSKLVEGDILKLTIRKDGSFLYKQIGPTARKRIVGKLSFDNETQKWMTEIDEHLYKILTASITFYKGSEGDEVIILVPESGPSSWGAVENIIPQ